ncbi:hypothetical protein D3C76_931460 [compost metagenome]
MVWMDAGKTVVQNTKAAKGVFVAHHNVVQGQSAGKQAGNQQHVHHVHEDHAEVVLSNGQVHISTMSLRKRGNVVLTN